MIKPLILLIALLLSSPAQSETIGQMEAELNLGHYSKATAIGQALLQHQPNNILVQFLTAVAYQQNNQTQNAQQLYQQIILDHPKLPEPRNNLALIHLQQGEHDQAIEVLIGSLKTHPAYATAWQNLNKLYQGLASEAYRKALGKQDSSRSLMSSIQLTTLTTLYDLPELEIIDTAPENIVVATATQKPQAGPTLLVATAPAAVVTTTTETVTVEKTTPNINQQLIKTVQHWAEVWSQKDFDAYIDAYTEDYKGDKPNHNDWKEYRRPRVLGPDFIKVKLTRFKVKSISKTQATIDFHQQFESPDYKDKVAKRIYLTKAGNDWKISRELTIAVL